MPAWTKLAAALAAVLTLAGCDPYNNAEKIFPLPDSLWDRAVASKHHQLFTIENISEAEFVNLRIMLENNGCRELKRDFFFSAVKKESPLIIKSHHGVLLLGKKNSSGLYPAAIYLKQKKTLLLGIGVPEK
ncbi:MAG: hypothetical protein E7045_05410 [Lentisphaerae bacterium]|nr:hypothetical protein [Lentisphaerota bacterium]